jgi:hypothetical protein
VSVYLIQCLCPQRHCILGMAYEADEPSDDKLAEFKANVVRLVAVSAMDPWCGICQSRNWSYETKKTPYLTLEEAEGPLRMVEAMQARTREFFKGSRN